MIPPRTLTHTVVPALVAVLTSGGVARAQAQAATRGIEAPAPVTSGHATLSGIVRDTSGIAVPFVQIYIPGTRVMAISDDTGAFRLAEMPSGATTVGVRRLGFSPLAFDVNLPEGSAVSLAIAIRPLTLRLSEVDILVDPVHPPYRDRYFASTGFAQRLEKGRGKFFTPDDVERLQPRAVSDLLRAVPEIRIAGRPQSPSARFLSNRMGGCRMNVFVDGGLLSDGGDDPINGYDIKAVEVYASAQDAPSQFLRFGPRGMCGSVVIWTK